MHQLWSPRDRSLENGSFDDIHRRARAPRPCPSTAPARFFRSQQPHSPWATPRMWPGDPDRILEAELEILQQRCLCMINDAFNEARSRISSRLHIVPETMVVRNPGPFAMHIDDPVNPNTFSTPRHPDVCDDFDPQALGELVGGAAPHFNMIYRADSNGGKQPGCLKFQDACATLASNSSQNGPSSPKSVNWQTTDKSEPSSGDYATASTTRKSVEITGSSGRRSSKRKSHNQKGVSHKFVHTPSDGEPDILSAIHNPENIRSINISFEGGLQASIHRLLNSTKWDLFIATVIITNAMFMGYQIDWATTHVGAKTPIEQYIIGYVYTVIFTFELVFRMIDEKCHFWSFENKMTHWNYLDCFIVSSSLVEVYFDYQLLTAQGTGGGAGLDAGQIRIVRIIRISRLMKIFRIARLVHFIRALRTLVFSIVCTLKSVFWALLLMLLFIYVFAMILTQAVGGYKEQNDCAADAPDLCEHWGNLTISMLSLFKAIAGGISWHEILVPLQKNLDPTWVMVFLFYIVFLYFAVLNVITGVFCESAIQSAKADQEMVIHEALQSKKKYKEKLERLFKEIDEDGSSEITLEELEQYMTSEMSGAFFEYLELEVNNASDVLKLIDGDGSGELTLDEFIEGVCRLRGPAKALDIAEVVYDNKAFQDWVFKSVEDMSNVLAQHFKVELNGQTPPSGEHRFSDSWVPATYTSQLSHVSDALT